MLSLIIHTFLLSQTTTQQEDVTLLEGIGGVFVIILWGIMFILAEYLYHSIFDVMYIGAKGCVTEIIVCGFVSGIASAIIVAVFGAILKYILIILAIIAVLAIIGTILNKNKNNNNDNSQNK